MAQGIYKIINVINNKFYVGSAVDFKRRKTRHFSELRNGKHNNKYLQAAWVKYGEQAFIFVIVEDLPNDADLLMAENIWLKEHVGKDYCYNLGVDATAPMLGMSGELSPTWGYEHTQESLNKISATSKGRLHKPESKEKIRQHLIGKPKSAAVRAKISATLSGDGNFWHGKQRPDHGAKVSKAIEVYKDDALLKVYDSIKALRDELKLKPPTVNRALKSGIKIVRGNFVGYSFKYTCTVTK
jgi:group I intron endonuclease